jgi:hypothetical protein
MRLEARKTQRARQTLVECRRKLGPIHAAILSRNHGKCYEVFVTTGKRFGKMMPGTACRAGNSCLFGEAGQGYSRLTLLPWVTPRRFDADKMESA